MPKQMELATAGAVTVRCFFGACGHVVDGATPEDAHRIMEAHYGQTHDAEIRALVRGDER